MSDYDTRTPMQRPLDYVELGPDLGSDLDRRLLGDMEGKRVLDLGCGAGHTAVGLARRGARVIATDQDAEQLQAARALAAREEVSVEFHESHPAELAFVHGDLIDIVVSVWSLSLVDDLDRVLRQAHRVLRPTGSILLSLPHPAMLCSAPDDPTRTVRDWRSADPVGERYVHTVDNLVGAFGRTNFTLDTLLERHADEMTPTSLVVRARKQGI